MEFATQKDNVREIDKDSRNKWRWDWLETDQMQQYLRKTKVPGQAFCAICNKTLKYQSGGKKDLKRHMDSPPHLLAIRSVETSYSLEGMLMGPKARDEQTAQPVRPVVPVNDRRFNAEAMILGFMAEHDLPYSLAPHLASLTQTLAKDTKALSELKLQRCTASYKMTFGVASHFNDELVKELRETRFCLNLDESTNTNNEKIVAVLVSFFSSVEKEIVVRHLASFKITRADSESIFKKLESLFDRLELPWDNLVSVLLDSCNTMRGKKSGLETRIRQLVPHLIDIDGDTVHHVHNAAKAFTGPFGYYLESLFNTIHSDFHWSTDLREELETICELIGVKFTMPERFTSHRFLYAYNLAVDTARLFDAYTLFYFQFLSKEERKVNSAVYSAILEKRRASEQSKEEMDLIGARLRKKKMTKDGKERKQKAINKLFDQRKKTKMLLGIYMSALECLKEYSVLFQGKQPMVHKLHDCQVSLLKQFLGFFVKPEKIPESVKLLKEFELASSVLLPKMDMFMGFVAHQIAKKKQKDHVVVEVLESMQEGFIKCGAVLLKKMPITTPLLRNVSAIDPKVRGHSLAIRHLKELPNQLKVLTDDENEQYMKEIYKYQLDPTLPEFTEATTRIDHWWGSLTDYPVMKKVALTVLCCFHGPMVEGVFNIMGDIIDSKSSRLDIQSVNAIQNIKSALKSKSTTSVKYFEREDTLYTPVVQGLVGKMSKAGKMRNIELKKKREIAASRHARLDIMEREIVTKTKAREIVSENVKRSRNEHSEYIKRGMKTR